MFKLRETGIMKVEKEEEFTFRSLTRVRTPKAVAFFAALMMFLFLISTVGMLFLPWRQSVFGVGEIIVFSPMKRPQDIEAQISGRLIDWNLRDGQVVKKNELIARIVDIDPRFLNPEQLGLLTSQRTALIAKKNELQTKANALQRQLQHTQGSQGAAVPAAAEKIRQAKDRLDASQQAVDAAEQNVKTTQWQVDRMTALYEKGLRSQRDQQVALNDNVRAKTDLLRANAAYDVVKKDLNIAEFEYKKVSADTSASVDGIEAGYADARQLIASTDKDIHQLDVDIYNLKARMAQREIRSPCDGRVVRLYRVGSGETVSAGRVLAVVAPTTEDRAAAIMIRDWDAPLVSVGREVRVTINGWPSLQFVGWPSIAVGTFAGRVSVIDAVDDGEHHYRVIVVPDEEAIKAKKEEPWPSVQFLRPGAQATGWILLSDVPLWYELWRQFNGFQPTVPQPRDETSGAVSRPNAEKPKATPSQ